MSAHHRVFASKYRVGYTAIFAGVIVAAGFCGIEQHAGIASLTFDEGEYEQLFLGLIIACLFVVSFIGATSISSQLLDKSNKIEQNHLIWVLQALLLVVCGFKMTSAAHPSLSIPLGVVTFAFLLAMQKAVMARSLADALGSNHAESVSVTSLGIELGNFIYESGTGDAERDTNRIRLQMLLLTVLLFVLGLWAGALSFHELGYKSCPILAAVCIVIWVLSLISDRLR